MKRNQNWDSMKHTAFSYSFTPKEFYFFLFKKPKCPDCGEKMLRQKFKKPKCPDCGEKMLRQKEYFSTRGAIPGTFTQEMASVNTKKVKYYYYTYTCSKCGKKYTLSELAK